MDAHIPISTINDFLYCPKSLYLHSVYSSFETNVYHDTPQIVGSITHENIEKGTYTTAKHILQGLSVVSNRLGIKGKIDLYDSRKQWLIERKYRVKQIYLGFKYQLYAQMYCLEEAMYPVKNLFIQSLSDNKKYEIALPTDEEKQAFEAVIDRMKSFTPEDLQKHNCSHCQNHIYDLLSW
jgi:CRISPR-associated protein Cas4